MGVCNKELVPCGLADEYGNCSVTACNKTTKMSGYYRPIRFAKWIKRDKWLYCSACDGGGWGLGAVTYEWQYCPLCGAKIGE